MDPDVQGAIDDARRAGEAGPAAGLIERLVGAVGAHAGTQAVFGDAVRQGDRVVIPVARVRWAFGVGEGSGPDPAGGGPQSTGSGGGGGVASDPVGYVEIGPSGASFVPIIPPYPSAAFLLAAGITAMLVLRGLARLIRG